MEKDEIERMARLVHEDLLGMMKRLECGAIVLVAVGVGTPGAMMCDAINAPGFSCDFAGALMEAADRVRQLPDFLITDRRN